MTNELGIWCGHPSLNPWGLWWESPSPPREKWSPWSNSRLRWAHD